jgi:nitrite reductase/ring-hydroxylating ferredoxin subunit
VRRLATFSDLVQLEPILVTLDGREVAVVRIEDEVYAFPAMCTHRAAPLVKGAVTWKRTVLCPWHLGTFSLRSGAVVAGPPREALSTYPVTVLDGDVFLDDGPAHCHRSDDTKGNEDAQGDLRPDAGRRARSGQRRSDLRSDGPPR